MIVLMTQDLFFASKVSGTGQAVGVPVAVCMSLAALKAKLGEPGIQGVILDLASKTSPADVVEALQGTGIRSWIAFGPHVDTAALTGARDAGFEHVMPRSRFSAELPDLLQSGLSAS